MELQKALLLVVLSLTAWTALALLVDRRGHAGIHRAFALLLACLGVTQGYFYSRLLVPDGLHALGLAAQATLWLKGPLLWWMVRLAVGRAPRWPALHLLPFVAALAVLAAWPVAGTGVQCLGALHALAYLVAALGALRGARPRLARIWRGHPNTSHYWLLWLVGSLLVLVLADLVLVLGQVRGALPPTAFAWVAWPISAWLLAVAWASLYRPPRFQRWRQDPAASGIGAPDAAAAPGQARQSADPAVQADPPPAPHAIAAGPDSPLPIGPAIPSAPGPRAWRELDESLALQLAGQLARLMDEQQLYRDGELSLPRLAGHLGISVHQASELLNVHLGTGFYDYLAQRRLDYACRLLRDPACEWRVIDIAFESGFGNKNSFYRQFRETFGVTPAEYRQRHQSGTAALA